MSEIRFLHVHPNTPQVTAGTLTVTAKLSQEVHNYKRDTTYDHHTV